MSVHASWVHTRSAERRVVVPVLAAAVVLVLVGWITSPRLTKLSTHGGRSAPASGDAPTESQAPGDQASPSERMRTTLTYDVGMKRFDPPAATQLAHRNHSAAYQAFLATGLYPDAGQYSTPSFQFGLYTDNGSGTPAANGKVIPRHARQPVWIVRFTGVPGMLSGQMSLSGQSGGPPPTVLTEIVAIVDDATGTVLEVGADTADH